ncbi:M23 family metallopeptidase [Alteriqipengyuania lutimaris]|uniref:M23 family metallopeptidase n=1 Tax=Alteriqipengyuania lutimaris TaxID=1538146 RepID=UPI0015F1AC6B|nr:M23 family metallopeptidase [Alteriqipengyuania lutimaris]MBB3034207.1 murein DD-endopeptidase MepM/ murein hydrolase activator NlpD [Alteriqipengyuania lutimaris]
MIATAALATFAVPAHANTSAAAAADVTDAVEEAQSPLGNGDAQFRQLFASWQTMDIERSPEPEIAISVAVPSRMPVNDARMSSSYGMRNHPVLRKRANHNGVDLAAPSGTPIYATADGVIERANYWGSYGNYIQIGHGNAIETRYAHLSRIVVSDGAQVRKGDLIGYVGSTGRSTGPHLHYEVRIDGKAVDPRPFMVETEAQEAFRLAMGPGGMGGGDEE